MYNKNHLVEWLYNYALFKIYFKKIPKTKQKLSSAYVDYIPGKHVLMWASMFSSLQATDVSQSHKTLDLNI